MIDITPDPIFIRLFGFPIYWYGIAYAVGLAAVYAVVVREARFRGLDESLIGTGMIVIAVAALVGGPYSSWLKKLPQRPIACMTNSPGATTSAQRKKLWCVRRTYHAPAIVPVMIPPGTPRPVNPANA